MTLQVNLLPAEYRRRTRRARRLKVWIALSVAMLVAQLMSAMFLRLKSDETYRARKEIAELQARQRSLTKELASLAAQQRARSRRTALIAKLRRKHQWSWALKALTDEMPSNAVLTRLSSDPPRDAGLGARLPQLSKRSGSRNAPATDGGKDGTATGILIEGISTNQESVMGFLGALHDDSKLGACELKSTTRQPFLDGHGVAFTIQTRWQ